MEDDDVRRDPWAWTGVACAAAFVLLAWMVGARGGLAFDDPVTAFLRGLPIPGWFWEACTFLGGAILIPIGALFVLATVGSGRVRLAVIVAVVLIGATLFTDGLKDVIARPRPPGEALAPSVGFSFPSGHTLQSTVVYGLMALVAWRSRLSVAGGRALIGVGLTLPFLVGLSRIALGVHYPSDVLAGWLGGIAFVAVARASSGQRARWSATASRGSPKLRRSRREPKPRRPRPLGRVGSRSTRRAPAPTGYL